MGVVNTPGYGSPVTRSGPRSPGPLRVASQIQGVSGTQMFFRNTGSNRQDMVPQQFPAEVFPGTHSWHRAATQPGALPTEYVAFQVTPLAAGAKLSA
jgi:hypothetical protein